MSCNVCVCVITEYVHNIDLEANEISWNMYVVVEARWGSDLSFPSFRRTHEVQLSNDKVLGKVKAIWTLSTTVTIQILTQS